jgi:fumarate hydratase class II
MTTTGGTRTEHDALGPVEVPSAALWRAQTQRAVENFPISGQPVQPELIGAIVMVKKASATANAELGIVPGAVADAIVAAADEVLGGRHVDQFPVDVFQTGSGTSSNMNVNEVLSTLATRRLGEPVHPNDHVNASQSSNDVFPSAIRIASAVAVAEGLLPSLQHLEQSLRRRADALGSVVKCGRTHLMDAVPVTLGQEFGGYASAIAMGSERIGGVMARLCALPLGGTAVGTGLNAPAAFAGRAIEILSSDAGVAFHEAPDHFEAQGGQDVLVELSGACRVVAVGLNKIANDIRWMASGPSTGLGEIRLPDLQPGSSIMPGKVNPVLPEAVHQVVAQVIGNDAAVAFGAAAGNFELNVMMPVMARNVLESLRLLASVSRLLADRCVDGIEANEETCLRYAESSPSLVTALVPVIGYEAAATVAKKAVAERRTVREVALSEGLATAEQLDRALDPLGMTRGGRRTDG